MRKASIGFRNKAIFAAAIFLQRLSGGFSITATTSPQPERREAGLARTRLRISWAGIPLLRAEEEAVLARDGVGIRVRSSVEFGPLPFLVRETLESSATVHDQGFSATYFLKMLGGRFLGEYRVTRDRQRFEVRLSNEFARTHSTLERVDPLGAPGSSRSASEGVPGP